MDGSLSYATGGRGIFQHVDGPFAGPTSRLAVETLGSGVLGGSEFGAFTPLTPEESVAVARETADALARLRSEQNMTSGEKATLDEAIEAASRWSAEASLPWYKKPKTWTWIIGGVLVAGGSYAAYRYVRRPR